MRFGIWALALVILTWPLTSFAAVDETVMCNVDGKTVDNTFDTAQTLIQAALGDDEDIAVKTSFSGGGYQMIFGKTRSQPPLIQVTVRTPFGPYGPYVPTKLCGNIDTQVLTVELATTKATISRKGNTIIVNTNMTMLPHLILTEDTTIRH
jgi:hypothetical protein